MDTLVIAEKPSVANRVASALGKGKAETETGPGGLRYYSIKTPEGTTFVAAAVGHLFTIRQTDRERGYPALNIEWAPSYSVGKKSAHTKEYLDLLEQIGGKCGRFINACDFDIEGTVIGTNILRHLSKGALNGNMHRMKFSTTTNEDLIESYRHLMPLDLNNFYAGEARHMLDWLWGINLSRALTYAVYGSFGHNALSIGRVQGPSLAIIVKREKEIAAFVPRPFWRITAIIDGTEFTSSRGDMFDKALATAAFEETDRNKDSGRIADVEVKEQEVGPYPPFDLTSLQVEASRALHLDPSLTLAIAQSLYEKAYISYPRTSSQKLPPALGLPKVIGEIARNPAYSDLATKLIRGKRYSPKEGAKVDEAHPAIYPTGILPAAMSAQEARLYDMIVRRFLACFAEDALVSRGKVTAKFGEESYVANGSSVVRRGWMEFYTYAKIDEKMLPQFKKGSKAMASAVNLGELKTQPPKRYTKAGLLSELEKRDLGTKATRAQIIDTLFRRNYIEGTSLRATEFGISVYEALAKNASMIVDEDTTHKLEEDMERISRGEIKEDEVISEGKTMLIDALKQFDTNKDNISVQMKKALLKSSVLGQCVRDGGDLVVRRSRVGKQFVACANYPKCTNTYSLPQGALIVPTGRMCEHCHTPFVKVVRKGRRPFEMDLDPSCITKKDWAGYKGPSAQTSEAAIPSAAAQQPQAPASAAPTQSGHVQPVAPSHEAAQQPARMKKAEKPAAKPKKARAKPRTKPKVKKKAKPKIGETDVPA